MVGHGGSSAGSYLADPTSPIPSHCASIVVTSTLRVKLAPTPVYVVLPGDLLGILCKKYGPAVYLSVKDRVLEGVRSNLERQPLSEADHEEQKKTEQLVQKLAASNTERVSW